MLWWRTIPGHTVPASWAKGASCTLSEAAHSLRRSYRRLRLRVRVTFAAGHCRPTGQSDMSCTFDIRALHLDLQR